MKMEIFLKIEIPGKMDVKIEKIGVIESIYSRLLCTKLTISCAPSFSRKSLNARE